MGESSSFLIAVGETCGLLSGNGPESTKSIFEPIVDIVSDNVKEHLGDY